MFFSFSFILLIILIFFIARSLNKKHKAEVKKETDWYLKVFLSKEDLVSQFFFLFSLFFFGEAILALNKDFGHPLSLRTILLLASLVGLGIGYYFKVIYTLTVSLIGLTAWWSAQSIYWIQGKDIKRAALFTGLLFIAVIFYLLSFIHEKKLKFKRVSILYLILGLIPIINVLFFLSTKSGLKTLEALTIGSSFLGSWEITFSLLIFLILIIGILIYSLKKKLIFIPEALIICLLVLLFGIIAFLPEQKLSLPQQVYRRYYIDVGFSGSGNLWATLFNVLVLIKIFVLIISGYLKNKNWLKKLGLFLINLLFLVKLFEWYNLWWNNPLLMSMGILIFLICGLMVYFLFKFIDKSSDLQTNDKVYSILGIVPLTLFLFFLSSEYGLRMFNFDIKSISFSTYLLILTSIYLFLNLMLWIFFFVNKIKFLKEASFLIVFQFLLTLIIFVFPHNNLFIKYNELSDLGTFWAILLNILLFFEIIGILFLGYLNKKHLFINLSVVFIFIFIFVKYFDWLFTFLDKSIFFIGAGILLFVVGWLMEKGRRYLISTIKSEDVSSNQ